MDDELDLILEENEAFLTAIKELQDAKLLDEAFELQKLLAKRLLKVAQSIDKRKEEGKTSLEASKVLGLTLTESEFDMPEIN